MKVLVCGGRDYDDRARVWKLLDFNRAKIDCIIHGNARGADTLAGDWARERGVELKIYPADWQKHGRRAGYLRNLEMAVEGKPDLVVAFPGGVGTRMMVDIARTRKIRVITVS